jgi:electron transport complex protein RnfB
MSEDDSMTSRRHFLRDGLWVSCLASLGAMAGLLLNKVRKTRTVWQIDPYTCVACGNCATYCVLEESAVKCVHAYAVCGYCRICFGFFGPEPFDINEGAENQVCPIGAIKRKYVEEPYYEYTIDEELCNGCGKCVKGCNTFGNGALFLQVRHDRCLNCNECSIAAACPSGAYKRVPAETPYLLKTGHTAEDTTEARAALPALRRMPSGRRLAGLPMRRLPDGVDLV